jgi:hypothetical protein
VRKPSLLPLAVVVVAAAACGGGAPATVPPSTAQAKPAQPVELVSDPEEYRIDKPSAEAGERIFTRTGIGDPYRTAIAFPALLALLRAYPDLFGADLPAFVRRFGFLSLPRDASSSDADRKHGLPMGMHLTIDPHTRVPFVTGSCVSCHAERVRWPGGEKVIVGLGSRHVRVHAYDAALTDVVARPDFSVERLAPLAAEAAREEGIFWPQDFAGAILGATVSAMRARAAVRASVVARTKDGLPGRVAVIESFSVAMGLALGREVKTAPAVGWSKVPDVIGFPHRRTLSWDGAGEGPTDILVVEADFALGVRPEWYASHPAQGPSLSAFLRAPRPRVPFPRPVDPALAEKGRALFETSCAFCHGTYEGGRVEYKEKVVPLAKLGTDRARADAVTDDFVAAANEPRLSHGVLRTQRTGGYVPPILTAIWTRAPYGHAGQWPSLAAMALPPKARPARFVVDPDAELDLDAVGVKVRDPAAGPPRGAEYVQDAAMPGLGNGGHPFLAELGAEGARAVIEYLKGL